MCVFLFFFLHVSKNDWIGVGEWCLANPSFSRIFFIFKLDKTPETIKECRVLFFMGIAFVMKKINNF